MRIFGSTVILPLVVTIGCAPAQLAAPPKPVKPKYVAIAAKLIPPPEADSLAAYRWGLTKKPASFNGSIGFSYTNTPVSRWIHDAFKRCLVPPGGADEFERERNSAAFAKNAEAFFKEFEPAAVDLTALEWTVEAPLAYLNYNFKTHEARFCVSSYYDNDWITRNGGYGYMVSSAGKPGRLGPQSPETTLPLGNLRTTFIKMAEKHGLLVKGNSPYLSLPVRAKMDYYTLNIKMEPDSAQKLVNQAKLQELTDQDIGGARVRTRILPSLVFGRIKARFPNWTEYDTGNDEHYTLDLRPEGGVELMDIRTGEPVLTVKASDCRFERGVDIPIN